MLATGPTGSGKSTTLYAALNAINSVDKKVKQGVTSIAEVARVT